ncbi:YheT family hydrolase [Paludibaculum fermentans]|uniref:YheT family hydrolase n=1 Tax=Paludibaculum fermentans TaxID=1473598 RepID=UPI003EB6B86E
MRPFLPYFRNPHLSTLAGNFWKREIDETRFPTRAVLYDTEPGTQVLIHENRPSGEALGEIFLHHGLEGSSRSGYMISLAQCLLESGFAVHRINMRSCGGTEALTPTLYHSGLTQDVRAILDRFRREGRGPRFLIGFSLGGNVTLKFAGESGTSALDLVSGVCAVSTPIDLHACVRRLGAKENWVYERRFVRGLKGRYRRRHATHPGLFPLDGIDTVRTVFDFDDTFTARAFQFGDAPNYYATQSALGFLHGIQVPTLMIQSKDDPMIPYDLFEGREVRGNPNILLIPTEHGGHLGFIAREQPRFWLDPLLRDWILQVRNKQGVCSV